jgi:periplasmic protein TonB
MTCKTAIACAVAAAAFTGALPAAAAEETRDYVARPVWTRTPTINDMHKYYPVRAGGAGGQAVLDCQIDVGGSLSNCVVRGETPQNVDLGAAALKLSRLFRMKPKDADGAPVADRWLTLPIKWAPGNW